MEKWLANLKETIRDKSRDNLTNTLVNLRDNMHMFRQGRIHMHQSGLAPNPSLPDIG